MLQIFKNILQVFANVIVSRQIVFLVVKRLYVDAIKVFEVFKVFYKVA